MPHTTPPAAAAELPPGIEIFKAGTRRAESGHSYTITPADVAAAAAAYDPAVHEAPLTVGHPEGDRPAYGWVKALSAEGEALQVAEHAQVEPAFAEMVSAGRFKKRSAAFYHPQDPSNPKPGVWYLRHVAYLGAQPPAVKGLKDIQFSAAAEAAVCFSDLPPTDKETCLMNEDLQAQLDAAQAATAAATAERDAAQAQVAAFAEAQRQERHAAHVAFAEAQVSAGRLLPKDRPSAVAVLDALAASAPVEFAEGDARRTLAPLDFVRALMERAPTQVQFGESQAGRPLPAAGAARGKSDAEIDQAARAYSAQHKVAYAEALTAVTAFAD